MQLVTLTPIATLPVGVGPEQPVLQHQRGLVDGESAGVRDEQLLVTHERLAVLSLRSAADASNVAFTNESSPLASAASVSAINRNRLAVRTSVAADARLSSHR